MFGEDTLWLYSDASVKGDFLAPGQRRQRGPALGAWCAWDTTDMSTRPCVAGLAFLGEDHGPNSAEYAALINGLDACRRHLQRHPGCASSVFVQTDSRWIFRQLTGEVAVDRLIFWHRQAKEAIAAIVALDGVESVGVANVEKGDAAFKRVHTITTEWSAIFRPTSWRPQPRFSSRNARGPG